MSENNVNGIIGADVATTTGIVGATVAIGQYIVNDYVITIAEAEGDYGYTMTITRGTDTQTITLYGLTPEQYASMLGYLEQAQAAAQAASGSANDAADYMGVAVQMANNATSAASRASSSANASSSYASQAQQSANSAASAKTDAVAAKTDAQNAAQNAASSRDAAQTAAANARAAQTAAEAAQGAAETAQAAAETAETSAHTYAGQSSQSASDAAQSAASAAQTLMQVQAAGTAQIAAIDAEGQRVIDSIPEDYSQMEEDVANLKSQMAAKASTDMALGAYPADTVSGGVASFSDGADSIPVKDLVIGIEPVQSGSGDPSPDNVRPISGWTGANVNANGTTIPITFPSEAGTVYGGTLDVTTGVLTVDRVCVDLGDWNWTKGKRNNSDTGYVYSRHETNYVSGYLLSSNRKVYISGKTWEGLEINEILFSVGYFVVVIDVATATEAKAALAGSKLVYKISQLQTYQLTPVEVLTIMGANTIYADTGNTTVNYRADPTLYADKRSNATRSIIAGIEPTMTASKAYTTGQLLIVGDTLYKVAASIASGATLTPGTNVNPTTVAEQLILLANA